MRRFVLLLSCFIFIFAFFTGCKQEQLAVSIRPGITRYSPAMSSVPGIPLKPEFQKGKPSKGVKFYWYTQYGLFLTWQKQNGQIVTHGKKVVNDGEQVYWTVDSDPKIAVSTFKISLKITDAKNGEQLTEANLEIAAGKEGFFFIGK